jgi:hypothetical protein
MNNRMKDDLHALLDAERDALISADFDALAGLEDRLLHVDALVKGGQIDPSILQGVVTKAKANGRLLQAAMKGVQSAQKRLKDMSDVRDGLSLYTQQGERLHVKANGRTLEKKA